MGYKAISSANSRKLKVGSRVRFIIGSSKMKGTVVEDRGPIGVKGRRLLRIRKMAGKTPQDEPETTFELPADELTLAS